MRSFFARVPFTDARGAHGAGEVVQLPYESDEDIANAQSMIRYGVISEQAPPPDPASLQVNNENAVVAQPPAEVIPVVVQVNNENAVTADGQPVEVQTHDHSVETAGDTYPTPDDPETPEWDARNEDGSFASQEDVEAAQASEEPAEEPAPAPTPKKRSGRKR